MDVLESIFTILDLNADKGQEVLQKFDLLVKTRVVQQLIADLPDDRRATIQSVIQQGGLPKRIMEELKGFYAQDTIEKYTKNVIENTLGEYVESILKTVSDEKKQAIVSILQEQSTLS